MDVLQLRDALPFAPETVGTFSCHGLEPGPEPGAPQGKINQDRGCVAYPFAGSHHQMLFAVYDGHGPHGDKVSNFAALSIAERLESHPRLAAEPARALKEVCVAVDQALPKEGIDARASGTTAIMCLCRKDPETGGTRLYVGNVGDSRAVLASTRGKGFVATNLSEDQKPDKPSEMQRIKAAGGHVEAASFGGVARVWTSSALMMPGLAMGRSIGDHMVGKLGVIAEPEVTVHDVREGDAFMILASDGVWEFLDSQPAVDIVAGSVGSSATAACRVLINEAQTKWREEEGDYRDDVTALIVRFDALWEPPQPKSPVEQLRETLATHHARVMSLFTAWDERKEGMLDCEEFVSALALIIPEAAHEAMRALFEEIDVAERGKLSIDVIGAHLKP